MAHENGSNGTATGPRATSSALAPAIAVLVIGAVLAVAGLAEIWVGWQSEEVADLARSELSDAGLRQHRDDFEGARAVLEGLNEDVVPLLALRLGVRPDELRDQINNDYPDVARLIAEQDEIVPFAELSLLNLERQQDEFQRADAYPVSWLPGWAGGAIGLVVALSVIALGALLLSDPGSWATKASVGLLSIAAALIAVPLIVQAPQKAADAEVVLDSLNPTEDVTVRTAEALETANAAAEELDEELLPELAAASGVTVSQFRLALAIAFPRIAAALQDLPEILDRYDDRLAIREEAAGELRTLKEIPVGTLGWFWPITGLVLTLPAAWALLLSRRIAA